MRITFWRGGVMYEKNIDNDILRLIDLQPEISDGDIAFNLSVPEELVNMRIAEFNDTREKILIMGYGHNICDSLKEVFESENYCVVKAPRGSSALETVKSEKPDLIVLDTGSADIDGFEIFRQLRASSKYSWIPVVMFSEKVEAKNRVKAFELGVDDYIAAPFNSLELKARINVILIRYRL
jgi:PleD family two-component response regulator